MGQWSTPETICSEKASCYAQFWTAAHCASALHLPETSPLQTPEQEQPGKLCFIGKVLCLGGPQEANWYAVRLSAPSHDGWRTFKAAACPQTPMQAICNARQLLVSPEAS